MLLWYVELIVFLHAWDKVFFVVEDFVEVFVRDAEGKVSGEHDITWWEDEKDEGGAKGTIPVVLSVNFVISGSIANLSCFVNAC